MRELNPEVPDESSNSSSNPSFDFEFAVEDISSDKHEVTEKADNAKITNNEKDTEHQVVAEQTLSSTEFTNQFINEPAKVNLSDILKYLIEPEVQSMVDVPVKQVKPAALRPPLVDITVTIILDTTTEAVDKFVEARLKQIDLSKYLPDFGKIKLEKASKQSIPKHSSTKFNKAALAIYDQKDKMYKMKREFKSYNRHLAHQALFNVLTCSLSVDEDDMDKLADPPSQKKRQRDDHDKDPPADTDKDSKKKKSKDHDVSSSKKTKDQHTSSKEWSKDPNADAGPEEDWFPELEKTEKVLEEFDDLLGSTFDFLNFIRHRHKKEKLTKADLEGQSLNFSKKPAELDWENPEGDRFPQDFSKPLPLLSAPGRLYILVEFFFNKDLEYLRSGNLKEKKYTMSLIKAKAARYELYGIEEMIPNMWSPSKVTYEKDAAY
ncbi:hypothetical protein Tco_0545869 [Tanacetum coccineum]